MLRVRPLLLACLLGVPPAGAAYAQRAPARQAPATSSPTTNVRKGIDASLEEFGGYVESYIHLLKSLRTQAQDMTVVSKLINLQVQATTAQNNLNQRRSEMTPEQVESFTRLELRLKNASKEAAGDPPTESVKGTTIVGP